MTPQDDRQWVIVDAADQTLGRLATRIAHVLRGKDRPSFRPNVDDGPGVIVLNAKRVRVTGKKLEQKFYARHSGYPGGIRMTRLDIMLEKHPDRVIKFAVRGMLPKSALGRKALKRLRVYADSEHQHKAQQPAVIEVNA
ncbi:MAG TPA: 50S ribosomal protein L13 [Chloroflexi bacterium]|nr:50S ribosomal protein L13 [Chloroflexota bacterium]